MKDNVCLTLSLIYGILGFCVVQAYLSDQRKFMPGGYLHARTGWILAPFKRAQDGLTAWFKKRRLRSEIMSQWPFILETLSVSALSGMDLVNAFHTAAKKTRGILSQEMEKVDARLMGGMALKDALAIPELAHIGPVDRLRAVLSQAQILGTPVSEVLNNLAQEYHAQERQYFEQRLNALPVKLSVITVVFLLPPLIIVTVVPHILKFMGARW